VLVVDDKSQRSLYPLKRLSVTKLKLEKLKRGSRNKTIKKFKTDDKFSALAQIRKIAKHNTRANLNDLQRFQVMLLRKQRSAAVRRLAKKNLKADAPKAGAKAGAKGAAKKK
jgi:large subunit ribosomal protein L14e